MRYNAAERYKANRAKGRSRIAPSSSRVARHIDIRIPFAKRKPELCSQCKEHGSCQNRKECNLS